MAGKMKRTFATTAVVTLLIAVPVWGQQAGEKPADSQPAQGVIKFLPPTPEQIQAARALAQDFADKAKAFAPSMHLVETKHFLIFSAWDRSNDKPLAEISERLYQALCRQFDIPATENLWVGKCPIYVFWEQENFSRFTVEVDETNKTESGGYQVQTSEGFCYIVMNAVRDKTRFYEVLVHETTHAFVGRYQTNKPIPRWVNEGLAEYMAATMVPGCSAAMRYVETTKQAVMLKQDVSHVFSEMGANAFDYGIAQSLVRFMIARNRKGFVKFITLIKEGAEEKDALKETFHLTHGELLAAWRSSASKHFKR